jgi:hypothetical protein
MMNEAQRRRLILAGTVLNPRFSATPFPASLNKTLCKSPSSRSTVIGPNSFALASITSGFAPVGSLESIHGIGNDPHLADF